MSDLSEVYVAGPPAGVQSVLERIWTDLLEVGEIAPDDDFFGLGGDSLRAVHMLAAVEEELSIAVSFTDFIENPTIAALALECQRAKHSSDGGHAATPLPDAAVPCSFAQERLWFVEQLSGQGGLYNMPLAVHLRGDVDEDALERALQAIVNRHDALRTWFSSRDGAPVQTVDATVRIELERHDVRGSADPPVAAQRLADEAASAAFDLERAPLMRALLVRVTEDERVLVLVFHHIVCDGASHVVIFRELGALYDALVRGEEPLLPPPRSQYPEFAHAQRSALGASSVDLEYWREKLAHAPEALELPTDRPPPVSPSYAGRTLRTPLDEGRSEALRTFSRANAATPFATALAVFDALLFRLSGDETIVVGTTTSGRTSASLADGVGLFANTVALRNDVSGEPTFAELVQRTHDEVFDAIAHQETPFEQLVQALQPERTPGRHPIFQVFFAHVPPAPLALGNATPFAVYPTMARFDLTLWLEERRDGFELVWEYATDLFDDSTMKRFETHFLSIFDAALADPQQRVTELPLLGPDERDDLLGRWSEVAGGSPVDCLHALFERQAAHMPDRPAVAFEGTTVSYGELNERANQLAHHLRAAGVEPETLIAVCLERSVELVVALLAILKAGGGYVPLDPEYPGDRLGFILEDSEAALVITSAELRSRLPEDSPPFVYVDRDAAEIAKWPLVDLTPAAEPENVAYVIYTSGSTGQPKGVLVEHRNVARLFSETAHWFDFGPDDVWTLLHSYAFDFSVWEYWGALLHGGTLVVPSQWLTRSPEALAGLLVETGVTVFNATPSLFFAVSDELLRVRDQLRLRVVVFGGEALQPALLRPWYELMPEDRPRLVNMYGITETTVHVSYRPLTAADVDRPSSPIGRPIPDLQLYLLDAKQEPVPIGVVGELYVGGRGVARGYLNRPELTSSRFISNPFGAGTLYRTGDLARHSADGEFEFVGRGDDQVKIRGFRIELGEIQSVLAGHDDVVEAVVVAVDAAPGEKRLAAYVVPHRVAATAFADDELQERFWTLLEERLPDYMVPSSLSILEQLPLTTNGKLDKAALPTPTWDRAQGTGYIAPRTATEVAVAEIWQEILQKDRVGVADNFFHLGGHSLLAARVITKVRKGLGVNPPVRALFEHPTLASFSDYLDGCAAESASEDAMPPQDAILVSGGGQPLSYTQRQLHFFEELAPEAPVYNAAFGVEARGPIDVHALERAIGDVIARHEALRTVFAWRAETPEQRTLDRWSFRIEEVDLRSGPEQMGSPELERVIRERVRRPFDLSRDVMLRVALIRLSETESVILFETHHIVFDAWSVEVFYKEVSALYAAYLNGGDPGLLPALQYQYRDFAGWQRDHLDARGTALDAYWSSTLAGAPTVCDLPSDRPRPLEPSFDGGTFRFELSPETGRKLQRVCREENVTPYMLLLAAFATLLYRRTGSDDILFGTPAANRTRPEFEQMIGFLANTVVIRVRLGGNPSFRRLLARVRESALGAYDHQDAPFERIVEAVRPRREHGVNPLFQVNFRVRTGQLPRLELPEVETAPLTIETGTARFDLALELHLDGPSMEGEFGYSSDIFEASTVERLADDFAALLGQALDGLETRLLSFEVGVADAVEEGKRGASIKGLRERRDASAGRRE